ncbi:ribbon-helix-helix domain-containing protein [Paludisphaera mucosa]|uniref:Ribbon-helix-helix domain-containing protein n=1 Tax=Paludisphaera mucosa TaxID=3030827 RepID=A0ABT6FLR7_9BACT|nr:ribbon-helix-helix domain-containing protein [Paludisphaera mucosa]MDG3008520.1 ribbon-helix-helix domain-containing protein [Paludisphaera mucosa]
MSDASEAGSGKGRKRQAPKTVGKLAASKVKATIHLSVEADQRLNIHCAMTGLDRSELVEQLINTHLRRYVVSDRGGGDSAREVDGEAA